MVASLHPRLQKVTRNCEIADQPRRDRAAARLDASAPVEQRDLAAPAREIVGRSRASGTAADNDEIENLLVIDHGMPFLMVRRQGRPRGAGAFRSLCAPLPTRDARIAAAMKSADSSAKTEA